MSVTHGRSNRVGGQVDIERRDESTVSSSIFSFPAYWDFKRSLFVLSFPVTLEQRLYLSARYHSARRTSFHPATIMVSRLRLPTVAVAFLSICLSVAVIGCAGRTIHVFNNEQKSNEWLLPIWPEHFDTRELRLLVGTSAATIVLNSILVLTLFIAAVRNIQFLP